MLLSRIISEEIDCSSIVRYIRHICNFHRVAVTDGYEQACDYVENVLRSEGLEVERIYFPAREDVEFLGYRSIKKWIVRSARLEIIYPGPERLEEFGLGPILADYKIEPLSIVQRSAPTNGWVECELINIDDCYDPESYGSRVRGNIVLVDGEADKVRALAVEKFGALGIVTDKTESSSIRRDPDLSDARVYQSFWWFGGEKKTFGFVVTPRQGRALRRLLKESKVIVRAFVDSKFVDDVFSIVTAKISGLEDEEIWVISHIDHPKPGAEDNASGVAVSMEIARILNSLLRDGKIPEFRRSIRFIYTTEFMGTAAYSAFRYSDIRDGKVIGAINLDMVASSEEHGGALLIIEPPYETGGYVAPLMRWLMNYLISTDVDFAGQEDIAMFKWGISKFSTGSDYYILSDPIIGIGTVGINRWPYKYYHTNKDTPDKIDPIVAKRVCVLAAVFLCILATIEQEAVDWLSEITKNYYTELMLNLTMETWTRVLGDRRTTIFKTEGYPYRETFSRSVGLMNLIMNAGKKSLELLRKSIGEWWDYESDLVELEKKAMESMKKIKDVFGLYANEGLEHPLKVDDDLSKIIPVRTGKLFDLEGQIAPLTYEKLREWREIRSMIPKYKYYPILDITLFKADGKKTLDRIIREIYYEFGIWAPQGIKKFFKFLERLGVVKLMEVPKKD